MRTLSLVIPACVKRFTGEPLKAKYYHCLQARSTADKSSGSYNCPEHKNVGHISVNSLLKHP